MIPETDIILIEAYSAFEVAADAPVTCECAICKPVEGRTRIRAKLCAYRPTERCLLLQQVLP
jgi:hypothetical protein